MKYPSLLKNNSGITAMPHILFLVWVLALVSGIAAITFLSILSARSAGKHIAFNRDVVLSFTVIALPLSAIQYVLNAGLLKSLGIWASILPMSAMGGVALLTLALPRFAHAVTRFKWPAAMEIFLAVITAVSFLGSSVNIFYRFSGIPSIISFSLLGLSIIYSAVTMIIRTGIRNAGDKTYKKPLLTVSVMGLASMPFLAALDFYYEQLVFLHPWLPRGFYMLPVCYLIWNVTFIVHYARGLISPAVHGPNPFESFIAKYGLSKRESEVMRPLIKGKSYQEIALELHISLATVKTHIVQIYRKTGAGNKLELVRLMEQDSGHQHNG